jgi:hypothetical protein
VVGEVVGWREMVPSGRSSRKSSKLLDSSALCLRPSIGASCFLGPKAPPHDLRTEVCMEERHFSCRYSEVEPAAAVATATAAAEWVVAEAVAEQAVAEAAAAATGAARAAGATGGGKAPGVEAAGAAGAVGVGTGAGEGAGAGLGRRLGCSAAVGG